MPLNFGYIADDPSTSKNDLAIRSVGRLLGARIHVRPESISHRHLVDEVRDQGSTGSCVGQAISNAVHLYGRFRAYGSAHPSAKGVYDVARLMVRPGEPLVDVGSYPSMAFAGVQLYGLASEERWPLTNENVNEAPPLDVFMAGASAKLSGWYRIPNGRSRVEDFEAALEDGHFPVFGMKVDDSFIQWHTEDTWGGPTSEPRGGHMMTAIGYRPDAIQVLNSWGESWGSKGCIWIAKSVFSSTIDAFVVTSAPSSVC